MATDIENFIKEQKAKIAYERNDLKKSPSVEDNQREKDAIALKYSHSGQHNGKFDRQDYDTILWQNVHDNLLSHVVPTSSASQQIVNACGNRSNPASGLDSCIAGSGQHEEQNSDRWVNRGRRRWYYPETAFDEKPMSLGAYELVRKKLQLTRQQEYNSMLKNNNKLTPTYKESQGEQRKHVESNCRQPHDIFAGDPANLNRLEKSVHNSPGHPWCYATLPIGADPSEGSRQHEKDQYRKDLEKQISETSRLRQRRRMEGTMLKQSNRTEPVTAWQPDRLAFSTPRTAQRSHMTPNYLPRFDTFSKLDQLSPRSGPMLSQHRVDRYPAGSVSALSAGGRVDGILESGFGVLLDRPRHNTLVPPPGLEYQPASYITQGTGQVVQSSVDEAYNFYATQNPLDNPQLLSSRRTVEGINMIPGTGLDHSVVHGEGFTGRSKVHFEDIRSDGNLSFINSEDGRKENAMKAKAYHDELSRQVEEKNLRKALEKEEAERYERKLEREARDYNPFGRGGGGAPMRDDLGNLVSDLRLMKLENDSYAMVPRVDYHQGSSYLSRRRAAAGDVRDDLIKPPPVQITADGEISYARGGHGIFGVPKTDAEKIQSERYKEELRKQPDAVEEIDEKKMAEHRRREDERMEEVRELRRVEEQQRCMQAEYDEEQKRMKEKEDEARQKNDELVRLAQERKRELEQSKRGTQEDDHEVGLDVEINTLVATTRGNSPPVPATRTRVLETESSVQANSKDDFSLTRVQSGDVLSQLAVMKRQLRNERQRVENQLQSEKKNPDVFDPRLIQRPRHSVANATAKGGVDVFEAARFGSSVPVHRAPAERANSQAKQEFTALRHNTDSESRAELNKMYPDEPTTANGLEEMQASLLLRQEESLRRLREQNNATGHNKASSHGVASHTKPTPHYQQLHSDSAFVDLDSFSYLPDDFDDMPRQLTAARRKSGRPAESSPGLKQGSCVADEVNTPVEQMGSLTSLSVDRLTRKNEERLKRLKDIQGDNISIYGADDVIDRFMSKQGHHR